MSALRTLPIAALAAVVLIAASAVAGSRTAAPLQAVVEEVGGKQVVAYYLKDGERCALTMMVDESATAREIRGLPLTGAARLRLRLPAGETVLLESVEGADIRLTCAPAATALIVETRPVGVRLTAR